jgi:hypothetical protein
VPLRDQRLQGRLLCCGLPETLNPKLSLDPLDHCQYPEPTRIRTKNRSPIHPACSASSTRTLPCTRTKGAARTGTPRIVQLAEAIHRKERKRETKRRRDAQRRPHSYARFKILLEVIGEERHVVNLEGHRARYAMILMVRSTLADCWSRR